MVGSFKVPTIFTAVDKVSKVVDGMQKKTDKFQKSLNKVSNYALAGGAAIATGLGFAVNEAIKFEDKMADVAKVMNLETGSAQLKKVSEEVKDLSLYLAQTPEATAELYGNIAQSGVAAENIGKVAKMAGEMGVAFGIGAGEAGESFVKLQNSMGLTLDQTKIVTDALNHLGNNTAAKSSELLEFMSSGGSGAARSLKMLGAEAAAVGSVLISSGKSASEAGTIFERMMKGIMKDANMRSIFQKNGEGLQGLFAVLEKGKSLKGDAQFKYFQKFGEYGTDISLMAKNMDLLRKNTSFVANENDFLNSSYLEFENRQNTTAQKVEKLKTQLILMAITIGENLLPIVNDFLNNTLVPLVKSVSEWTKENEDLIPIILGVGVGLFGLGLAIKAVLIIMTVAKAVMAAYTAVMKVYNIAQLAAAVGGYTLAGAIWAALWPVLLVIAAIAAIIAIFYYWDEICAWFSKQWEKFTNWIGELWDKVVKWFQEFSFENFFKSIGNAIIDYMLFPLRTVLGLVAKIPGKIGDMAKQALEFTSNIKFDIEPTKQAELSPQTTAQVSTSESITTNKSSMQVNFNDKNNNIAGIQQFGNPIPVFVNNTKYGQ